VFVCILFLLVKSGKGDFIPPKYAERSWSIAQLVLGNKDYQFITKEQSEAWIQKMKTPEIILVTTWNLMESMILNNQTVLLNILGVGENYFDVHRVKFISGRPINRQEIADNIPVAVIDRLTAGQYFGKNEDPIGKNIELNGIQYSVVGIVENPSFFTVVGGDATAANMLIPIGTAKAVNQSAIRYNIWFTAKNKASIADMQAEFIRIINEGNTAEDEQYGIAPWHRKSVKSKGLFSGSEFMVSIFGSLILMLIPAFNILSLNVSKSYDRSEEIAVRKAFGAPLSTIFWQLFFENALLTLAGAIMGMCITPLALYGLDQLILRMSVLMPMVLGLNFDWVTVFLVAGPCVLLFSFLSGSIPA
jgi:putative ABC transport system permease protein